MARPSTTSDFKVGPARNKRELSALLDILATTFNFARHPQADEYANIVGPKNFRVIRKDRELIGGCALIPAGQFFGGKSVPMMGVAAVGIAPEYRGGGAAAFLMRDIFREMRRTGFPISTLYPATLPLYRSVGYEQAGVRYDIRIPAKTLFLKKRDEGMTMRRATAKDERAIRRIYREFADHHAGNLDRSDFHWQRIRSPRGNQAQGFLVVNHSNREAEGYVFTLQKESFAAPDAHHAPLTLYLADVAFTTPAAGRRLLRFCADHRSMIDQVILQGSADHPLLKLLPERNYSARLLDHWMVRIVDVPAALKSRGYASSIDAEVHLNVMDDAMPENDGRFVLKVNGGGATVKNGGRGEVSIDVRGLAAIYTGHLSPRDLLITGQMSIKPPIKNREQVLNDLGAVFAGPAPWLSDMF